MQKKDFFHAVRSNRGSSASNQAPCNRKGSFWASRGNGYCQHCFSHHCETRIYQLVFSPKIKDIIIAICTLHKESVTLSNKWEYHFSTLCSKSRLHYSSLWWIVETPFITIAVFLSVNISGWCAIFKVSMFFFLRCVDNFNLLF